MANTKSLEVLLAELREFLRVYNRNIDAGDNSIVKDLLLYPFTVGGKAIMDQVDIARKLSILSKITGGDLVNEATNYRLEKLPGSFAIVSITFYTESVPTTDIIIPAGAQVATVGTSFSSPVSFSTISQVRFSVSDAASYYSFDRDRYEFSVTAICDTIGTGGNVGAGLISKLLGTITGISGATNLTASYGGLNEEDDDDLRERIVLAKLGRDLNTTAGLQKFARAAGFTDAYPVRVEDADSERATGIDVFVINNSSATVSETFTYDPANPYLFLTNRPVLEVTSIVGSNFGTLSLSQYDAIIDGSSPMRRSTLANDYVRLSTAGGLLLGEQITVTYNYASLISQVQETFDLNENEVLTADPLVKRAYPLYLYLNAKLTLKANADGPATRNKVRNALAQYIATYRLGDDIQKSDFIVVLQTGYGDYPVDVVDYVQIQSYYLLDVSGSQRNPIDEVIAVGNKEYVVLGRLIIT